MSQLFKVGSRRHARCEFSCELTDKWKRKENEKKFGEEMHNSSGQYTIRGEILFKMKVVTVEFWFLRGAAVDRGLISRACEGGCQRA